MDEVVNRIPNFLDIGLHETASTSFSTCFQFFSFHRVCINVIIDLADVGEALTNPKVEMGPPGRNRTYLPILMAVEMPITGHPPHRSRRA
jgi:hypothetical protein